MIVGANSLTRKYTERQRRIFASLRRDQKLMNFSGNSRTGLEQTIQQELPNVKGQARLWVDFIPTRTPGGPGIELLHEANLIGAGKIRVAGKISPTWVNPKGGGTDETSGLSRFVRVRSRTINMNNGSKSGIEIDGQSDVPLNITGPTNIKSADIAGKVTRASAREPIIATIHSYRHTRVGHTLVDAAKAAMDFNYSQKTGMAAPRSMVKEHRDHGLPFKIFGASLSPHIPDSDPAHHLEMSAHLAHAKRPGINAPGMKYLQPTPFGDQAHA